MHAFDPPITIKPGERIRVEITEQNGKIFADISYLCRENESRHIPTDKYELTFKSGDSGIFTLIK